MPGRFDKASNPTERALTSLHEAIQREARRAEEPDDLEAGRRRPHRKGDLTLVVGAVAIMILVFILLLFWLR
jgi:ferric-dicitrate binding protein FerR (iron transport regulator)